MRKLLVLLAMLAAFSTISTAKELLNLDRNGVAIQGYDPVAFFTDNRPVQGNQQFKSGVRSITSLPPNTKPHSIKSRVSTNRSSAATAPMEPVAETRLRSRSRPGRSLMDACSCSMTSTLKTTSTKTNWEICARLIKIGRV
jgi:hypothetical protein